jgi:hypothetical protein
MNTPKKIEIKLSKVYRPSVVNETKLKNYINAGHIRSNKEAGK